MFYSRTLSSYDFWLALYTQLMIKLNPDVVIVKI